MFVANDFMDAKEVCELFRVSRITLYNWVKSGKLGQYQTGRKALYLRTEVEKLLLNSVTKAS